MTPKQLCQDIVAGKWNGAISAPALRDAAKKALEQAEKAEPFIDAS